jgi:hypothetical protein
MSIVKRWLLRPLIFAIRRVQRPFIILAARAPYVLLYVRRRIAGHRGTILLEPNGLRRSHSYALFKICADLGWAIKDGRQRKDGLRLFWPSSGTPEARAYPDLINGRCININKSVVVKHFEAIFGYGYAVDPRSPSGPYVRKSETNALHDGQILEGPREPEPGFVYQRFINIGVGEGMGEDIRLIFMRGLLPYCYRNRRPLEILFGQKSTVVSLETTSSLLSDRETLLVGAFCDAMGLDYGELDCLRDRDDARLYVVDVNRTPVGPPRALPRDQTKIAVQKMAAAFAKAFPMPTCKNYASPLKVKRCQS